jgi:alkylhydroperoxidase family enzyme
MTHHGAGLRRILSAAGTPADEQETLLRALEKGPVERLPLGEADRALVAYADRLTRAPADVGPGDIARLRGAGFDDGAIHDACAISAYYTFVNRIADGLGVELERGEAPE